MIILYDTREKLPWDFSFYGHVMEQASIKTGDYTIKGHESEIIIERKKSTGEIAQNIGSKSKAFNAEISRMQSIKRRYMIFEFSPQDLIAFPDKSGIPLFLRKKVRINSAYLAKEIERYENECNVTVFFCNNREQAMSKAIQLLEECYEEVKSR